jgi:RNA polymerase sigma factor (sigma-70 family)
MKASFDFDGQSALPKEKAQGNTPETCSPILDRCRQGDNEAWSRMLRKYGTLVKTVARRIGLTPDQADEVFQHTFISLFQSLTKLRNDEALCKWLIVATRRNALREKRKGWRDVELESQLDIQSPCFEELVLQRMVQERRQTAVTVALNSLSPDAQRLIHLLFVEGRDYESTAKELSLSLGSVGPIRARSLKRLAGCLSKEVARLN